jgi:hypothetical protein
LKPTNLTDLTFNFKNATSKSRLQKVNIVNGESIKSIGQNEQLDVRIYNRLYQINFLVLPQARIDALLGLDLII